MSDESELPKTRPSLVTPMAHGNELDALPLLTAGRYVDIEGARELGHGGMGRVLRVLDTHLRREVAVKELLPEHAHQASELGPLIGTLFIREARVMARLEHPGVVPVYELARKPDGSPFYAMRHIEGRSLASALERCNTLADRLTLLPHFIDVVQTIAYAHSKGVVHRDLKPANVMVGPFGETQVLDWGLAHVEGEADLSRGSGTPAYMAPEHKQAAAGDARSDVWSLGIMLFELLAGHTPDGKVEIDHRAPKPLIKVINRALQPEPANRFSNAGEMAQALEAAHRFVAPSPARFVVMATLGAVAVLTLVGVLAQRSAERDAASAASKREASEALRTHSRSVAESAVLALRAKDTQLATRLAEAVPDQPLARGVGIVARERGVPVPVWSVGVEAGCTAVAEIGGIVACATLGGVSLFDVEDGHALPMLKTGPVGWQRAVVAVSPTHIASGGDDRIVHLWSPSAGAQVQQHTGFESTILSLASSGTSLFVGLRDGRVIELSPEGRQTVRWSLPGPVQTLAAAKGVLAASGGSLVRVQFGSNAPIEIKGRCGALLAEPTLVTIGLERSIIELSESGLRRVSTGHRDDVSALVQSPRLISADGAGEVHWWFSDQLLEGTLSNDARITAMSAVHENEVRVILAPRGPTLMAIDLPRRLELLPEDAEPTFHAWWSRGWFVSGLRDGRIRRYDVGSADTAYFESHHEGAVRVVVEVKGEQRPEALRHLSAGDDGRVLAQRWNGEVTTLDSSQRPITALAVDDDAARAAWSFNDGTLVVWSLKFQKEISREQVGLVHALAFSPNGRTLAAGREDKRIALYDAETGKPRAELSQTDGAVLVLTWSHDGEMLYSAGADARVTQWRSSEKTQVRTLSTTARGQVTAIDVSPDGSKIAAGSEGEVFIWETDSGALWARLPADGGRWSSVHFIDDSRLFAIGTDRVPHLWSL